MALTDVYNVQHPGQKNDAGAVDALHLEEYTGVLESTIARRSALSELVPFRTLKGTSMMSNFAVGESTLQKVDNALVHLDGTRNDFSKTVMHVETTIFARNIIPLIEVFQTEYDARKEIGLEHGKLFAKHRDQALAIQSIKAGLATDSAYSSVGGDGKPKGHFGGTQVTLDLAADAEDPALLYAAVLKLITGMQLKDVDPRGDDVLICVRPDVFMTLCQNDQLINQDYKSSEGNVLQNATILKALGVPIISSNNFPMGSTISNHLLTTANQNFDGDFTKVVAFAMSPRALMAAETIPLTPDVFFDKLSKKWMVDAHTAYSAGHNRREFAGVILKP